MNRMFVIHLSIPAVPLHNPFLILFLSTDVIQRVKHYSEDPDDAVFHLVLEEA